MGSTQQANQSILAHFPLSPAHTTAHRGTHYKTWSRLHQQLTITGCKNTHTYDNQSAFCSRPMNILWASIRTSPHLENSGVPAPRSRSGRSTWLESLSVALLRAVLRRPGCGVAAPCRATSKRGTRHPPRFSSPPAQFQTTAHWSTAQSRPPREMRRLSSGRKSTAVT